MTAGKITQISASGNSDIPALSIGPSRHRLNPIELSGSCAQNGAFSAL
jgi:hypothetical protein